MFKQFLVQNFNRLIFWSLMFVSMYCFFGKTGIGGTALAFAIIMALP